MEQSAKSPGQLPKASRTIGDGLHDHILRAYELLGFANRHNIPVPSDVVAAVTGARRLAAPNGSFADHDAETRFWNAYGLLSSINPAYVARRRYRRWFYVWLAVLLGFQAHYLAATLVSNGLQGIEKEWQAADQGTPGSTSGTSGTSSGTKWQSQDREARACAYYRIANGLLLWTQGLDGLCTDSAAAPGAGSATAATLADKQTAMIKVSTIRDLIDFFASLSAGYLLPLLYGLLGAYAFVLRKLAEPLDTLNFAHDMGVSYPLRLQIGALAGLAVGWFINGSQPLAGVGSLSPVALAFAAGFGSDLLFATLDKIVGAFTPAPASRTAQRTESTVGGVTLTTETQRETHVAGALDSTPIPENPATSPGPIIAQPATA